MARIIGGMERENSAGRARYRPDVSFSVAHFRRLLSLMYNWVRGRPSRPPMFYTAPTEKHRNSSRHLRRSSRGKQPSPSLAVLDRFRRESLPTSTDQILAANAAGDERVTRQLDDMQTRLILCLSHQVASVN